MKYFDWDKGKSDTLREKREVGFEEAVTAITEGGLLDIVEHHNKKRYPNQKIFVINIAEYVYLVPFVEDSEKYFLKTIFPSRKMTKKYLY